MEQGIAPKSRISQQIFTVSALSVFGCLVWISYRIGIAFYFEPEHVATFWITNGLVIGALIMSPRRLWLPLLAIQYVIQFILNLSFSTEFAVVVTTVNSLSAIVAAAVTQRITVERFDIRRLRHMLAFITTILLAEALNGLGGAFAVTRSVDTAFWPVWQIWTFSTVTGSLIVGAATVAAIDLFKSKASELRNQRGIEGAILLVVTVVTCHFIFSQPASHASTMGYPFFALLFLIWAALRLGPNASLILLLIVSVQLVYHADHGQGPLIDPSETTYERALGVQGYLIMNLLVTLIVTALNAERDASLQKLEESRERFRALVETTSDWVWELDDKAHFTYTSPRVRDILGYEPCELDGKSGFDLMPPDEAKRISVKFNEFIRQRKGFYGMQNINLHKNGQRVVLESSGAPFFDAHGNVKGYRGIDRDVTAKLRAEEEKAKLQKKLEAAKRIESLGTLAGGVAHDLNNILGPVVALPEMLREDLAKAELPQAQLAEVNSSLALIEESARTASRVVADLLTLGRRSRHLFTSCDLTSVPTAFLESRQFQDLQKRHPRVSVSFETDCGELMISADSSSLSRVMANLTTNAFDSLAEEGNVSIRVSRVEFTHPTVRREVMAAGTYGILSVSDNGCGIEKADLDHVFEPFFSLKGKTKHSGSGLGLSVVHGIIKDHNGYIDIDSIPGEGTTFTVYLPELVDTTTGDTGNDEAALLAESSSRVLVVDDLPVQRLLSRRCLEPLGYHIEEAPNGRSAVRLFEEARTAGRKAPFDVVLLDMIMEPDFDGADTCMAIAGLYPEVPVIIVSGHAENSRFEATRELGATFLRKPYRQKELINAIAERLA